MKERGRMAEELRAPSVACEFGDEIVVACCAMPITNPSVPRMGGG
jgi:hypothetical protein